MKDYVIWGWPYSSQISGEELKDKSFIKKLHLHCKTTYPHYDGPVPNEDVCADDCYIDVESLSRPEKDKVWDWIESQGIENGEA